MVWNGAALPAPFPFFGPPFKSRRSMTERLCIVDCGSGNLHSVENAAARAAREAGLAVRISVSSEAEQVASADRIILPGVGAFGAYVQGLAAIPGLLSALEKAVLVRGRPFLGICVGMQALATRGFEFGQTDGLGWIAGEVRRLEERPGRRIPHMGWNEVAAAAPHPVCDAIGGRDAYFLHSFHFVPENTASAIAFCSYGESLVAAVARDNILGVQFHPEKSQDAGLDLLAAFLRWRP
jgi:glutamine amidotransferase